MSLFSWAEGVGVSVLALLGSFWSAEGVGVSVLSVLLSCSSVLLFFCALSRGDLVWHWNTWGKTTSIPFDTLRNSGLNHL